MASSSYKSGILSILLIFPSLFHLCLSDGGISNADSLGQLLNNVGTQVENLKDVQGKAQCMQKLLPCNPFFKAPINPPPICCDPIKEVAANNGTDCLCIFYNDPSLRSTLALSKDEVMRLPNACGVTVDFSKCDNSGGGLAEEKQDSSSSTRMTSPYGITLFGVPAFVTMLIVLVFSAY